MRSDGSGLRFAAGHLSLRQMLSWRLLFAGALTVLLCMGATGSFRAKRGGETDSAASAIPKATNDFPRVDAGIGATPLEVGAIAADAETAASPLAAGGLIVDTATGATPTNMTERSGSPLRLSPSTDAVSGASPAKGDSAFPGTPPQEAPTDAGTGASPRFDPPSGGPVSPGENAGTPPLEPGNEEEGEDKDERAPGDGKVGFDSNPGKRKSKKSSFQMAPESFSVLVPGFIGAAWALGRRRRCRLPFP